jgi:CO dehydrogenase maturation factor
MKIAVTGKGGVGKTTLSGMLACYLASDGREVVAVDADPDANLASALGVPADEPVTPISEMTDMIAERTGSKDNYGGYFKLNPKVDDIPGQYARRIGSIRLLVLGGVSQGGAGCICPATALIKALLSHLVLGRDGAVVMDMEAGIEHLGRATAESMDALLVVVTPGPWSIQTAGRIRLLAGQIGLRRLFAVANNISDPAQLDMIRGQLDGVPLIGHLSYDPRLTGGVVQVVGGQARPTDACQAQTENIRGILSELKSRL